jgi:hypothetical protein
MDPSRDDQVRERWIVIFDPAPSEMKGGAGMDDQTEERSDKGNQWKLRNRGKYSQGKQMRVKDI